MNTLLIIVLLLSPVAAVLADTSQPDAQTAFELGKSRQERRETGLAIQAYKQAIALKPDFALAHYELGWSYWVEGKWDKVIQHWQQARKLGLQQPQLDQHLKRARDNLAGRLEPLQRPEIGIHASSGDGLSRQELTDNLPNISLTLSHRFQHYNMEPKHPDDVVDNWVFSPKSARFSADGSKVYVNALEAFRTLIFDPASMKRTGLVRHTFSNSRAALFNTGSAGKPWGRVWAPEGRDFNQFKGKPVESTLSHHDRYLWIPYYRRDFDAYSTLASAIAVIDTRNHRIVRVLDTGPIPKTVAASPDSKWLAVAHWGDNTVGLIDIAGNNPAKFQRRHHIAIGKQLDLSKINSHDRDHGCGACLRGAVFTADSRYLVVGRMGGGGLAVIDVEAGRYLGTVWGMPPTPRHLVLSPDSEWLYLSSSLSGSISRYRLTDVVNAARNRQRTLKPLQTARSGQATRTIDVSPDGKWIFAAVNRESKIAVLSAPDLKPVLRIDTDSFPVGLAISPDGKQLWVTAQGRKLRGGNAVSIFTIETDKQLQASQ
jgi:DNA-binding beta-propeller fold protein YncE